MRRGLFFFLVMLTVGVIKAHDVNHATLMLNYNANKGWHGQLTLSTYGFENMLTKYLKDESFRVTNTDACKAHIKSYLQEKLKLKVNKFFEVSLDNFTFSINDHAIDVWFKLKNVPQRPEYWALQLNYLAERKHLNTILQTNIDEVKSRFVLKGKTEHVFRKDDKGSFVKVSN